MKLRRNYIKIYPAVPPIRNFIAFGVFAGVFGASDLGAGVFDSFDGWVGTDFDPIRFSSMSFRYNS
jgi:hypothetical protein